MKIALLIFAAGALLVKAYFIFDDVVSPQPFHRCKDGVVVMRLDMCR